MHEGECLLVRVACWLNPTRPDLRCPFLMSWHGGRPLTARRSSWSRWSRCVMHARHPVIMLGCARPDEEHPYSLRVMERNEFLCWGFKERYALPSLVGYKSCTHYSISPLPTHIAGTPRPLRSPQSRVHSRDEGRDCC